MLEQKTQERLVKFLELTRSDSDGEALSAMRRANELLKKVNLTWTDLLHKDVRQPRQEKTYKYYTQEKDYHPWYQPKNMLDFLVSHLASHSSIRPFIESLEEQWKERGSLSNKQYEALLKIYKNAKEKG